MSQHHVILDNGLRLQIGWDGPLRTYFADVFDDEADDEDGWPVASFGMMIGETITEIDDLRDSLAEQGYEISDELAGQLEMDKLARGTFRFPTQQAGLDMLGFGD